MKTKNVVAICILGILLLGVANAAEYLDEAQSKICDVLGQIYQLLLYIASGVAALVIVAQGVTWVASADDAKARKGAKVAVIHAIIGLIVVSLALVLVAMVLPEGSECVTTWPGWGNITGP